MLNDLPDFTKPIWYLIGTIVFFAIIVARYFIIAGLFHLIFNYWFKDKWSKRKINLNKYKNNQYRKEVFWSTISAIIFAFITTLTFILWQEGLLKVYVDIKQYPIWWMPASLIISLIAHETYYYWLHRWMHKPAIFKIIHKVHHESHITSPWTAFSFHPIEGLFQAIFIPLLILLLPINIYVILMQLIIMTFSSVINHLNIEIYPKHFLKNTIGKYLIGATHHALHHKQFKYNYGLYFTFWDKLKHTESPAYDRTFKEKTNSI